MASRATKEIQRAKREYEKNKKQHYEWKAELQAEIDEHTKQINKCDEYSRQLQGDIEKTTGKIKEWLEKSVEYYETEKAKLNYEKSRKEDRMREIYSHDYISMPSNEEFIKKALNLTEQNIENKRYHIKEAIINMEDKLSRYVEERKKEINNEVENEEMKEIAKTLSEAGKGVLKSHEHYIYSYRETEFKEYDYATRYKEELEQLEQDAKEYRDYLNRKK